MNHAGESYEAKHQNQSNSLPQPHKVLSRSIRTRPSESGWLHDQVGMASLKAGSAETGSVTWGVKSASRDNEPSVLPIRSLRRSHSTNAIRFFSPNDNDSSKCKRCGSRSFQVLNLFLNHPVAAIPASAQNFIIVLLRFNFASCSRQVCQ